MATKTASNASLQEMQRKEKKKVPSVRTSSGTSKTSTARASSAASRQKKASDEEAEKKKPDSSKKPVARVKAPVVSSASSRSVSKPGSRVVKGGANATDSPKTSTSTKAASSSSLAGAKRTPASTSSKTVSNGTAGGASRVASRPVASKVSTSSSVSRVSSKPSSATGVAKIPASKTASSSSASKSAISKPTSKSAPPSRTPIARPQAATARSGTTTSKSPAPASASSIPSTTSAAGNKARAPAKATSPMPARSTRAAASTSTSAGTTPSSRGKVGIESKSKSGKPLASRLSPRPAVSSSRTSSTPTKPATSSSTSSRAQPLSKTTPTGGRLGAAAVAPKKPQSTSRSPGPAARAGAAASSGAKRPLSGGTKVASSRTPTTRPGATKSTATRPGTSPAKKTQGKPATKKQEAAKKAEVPKTKQEVPPVEVIVKLSEDAPILPCAADSRGADEEEKPNVTAVGKDGTPPCQTEVGVAAEQQPTTAFAPDTAQRAGQIISSQTSLSKELQSKLPRLGEALEGERERDDTGESEQLMDDTGEDLAPAVSEGGEEQVVAERMGETQEDQTSTVEGRASFGEDDLEREERRKRVDEIMERTRTKGSEAEIVQEQQAEEVEELEQAKEEVELAKEEVGQEVELEKEEVEKEEVEPVKEEVEPVKEEVEPVKEEVEPVKEEVEPVKEEVEPVKEEVEPVKEAVELVKEEVEQEVEKEDVELVKEEVEKEEVELVKEEVEPVKEEVALVEEEVKQEVEKEDVELVKEEVEKEDVELVEEEVELVKEEVEKEGIELIKEEVELVKEEIELVKEEVELVEEEVEKEEVELVKEEVGLVEEEVEEQEEAEKEGVELVEECVKEEQPVQIEEDMEQIEDIREASGEAEEDQGSANLEEHTAVDDALVISTAPVISDDTAHTLSTTEDLFSNNGTLSAQDSFEFKLAYEPQDQVLPTLPVEEVTEEVEEEESELVKGMSEVQASDQVGNLMELSRDDEALENVPERYEEIALDIAHRIEDADAVEDAQVIDAMVEENEEVELEMIPPEEKEDRGQTSSSPAAEVEVEVNDSVQDLNLQHQCSSEEEKEAEGEVSDGLDVGTVEVEEEDDIAENSEVAAAEGSNLFVPEEIKSEEVEEEVAQDEAVAFLSVAEEDEAPCEIEVAVGGVDAAVVEEDNGNGVPGGSGLLFLEESEQLPQSDDTGAGKVEVALDDVIGFSSEAEFVAESSAVGTTEMETDTPVETSAVFAEEDIEQLSAAVVSEAVESAVGAGDLLDLTEGSASDYLASVTATSGFGDILDIDFGTPKELATEDLPEIAAEEFALIDEGQPIGNVPDSSDGGSEAMEPDEEAVDSINVIAEVDKTTHNPFSEPDEVEQELLKFSSAEETEVGLYSTPLISGQVEKEEDLTTGDGLEFRSSGSRSGSGSGGESADTPVLPADTHSASSSPIEAGGLQEPGGTAQAGIFHEEVFCSKREDTSSEPLFVEKEVQEEQLVSVMSEEELTTGDGFGPSDLVDDAATPEPKELSKTPELDPFRTEGSTSDDQPLLELSDSNEFLTAGIADTALEPQQDLLTNPFSAISKAMAMDDPFGFQLEEETGTYPQPKSQVPADPGFTLEEAAAPLQDPLPVSTTLATEDDDAEDNLYRV